MINKVTNTTDNIDKVFAENEYLRTENISLKEQLAWFKRQIFGPKSERVTDMPGNTPELPGFDFKNAEVEILPKSHIKPHDRKKSKSRKGEFKLEIGKNLVCIGYDKSYKLATKPEQHYILRTLRPKYTLKEDSLYGIVQAKADDCIIEGSKFDTSFMAYAVCDKFCYHMPLYRITEKLKYQDIGLCRQSLTSLVIELGLRVQPVVDLMRKELFKQHCLLLTRHLLNLLLTDIQKL